MSVIARARDVGSRLAAQVKLHGPWGTAVVVARQLAAAVYADDHHVWYEVAVSDVRDLPLRPGLTARAGTVHDLRLVEHIPPVSAYRARVRLEDGHAMRLVLTSDGEVAFVCWLLRDSAPELGLAGARPRTLPAGVLCLEDSVCPPRHRGGGMGSAGMSQALLPLRGATTHSVVTRVAVDNIASRKAVTKVGFTEVLTVHERRLGRRVTRVLRPAPGREDSWLVRTFDRTSGVEHRAV